MCKHIMFSRAIITLQPARSVDFTIVYIQFHHFILFYFIISHICASLGITFLMKHFTIHQQARVFHIMMEHFTSHQQARVLHIMMEHFTGHQQARVLHIMIEHFTAHQQARVLHIMIEHFTAYQQARVLHIKMEHSRHGKRLGAPNFFFAQQNRRLRVIGNSLLFNIQRKTVNKTSI